MMSVVREIFGDSSIQQNYFVASNVTTDRKYG